MPLILVPTPIGNLEDITLRALRALRSADVIACEDTRTTGILLNRYSIKRPLVSYHDHNEHIRSESLLKRLQNGETVALVSDAGTPALSDPGYVVLKEAIESGIEIDALPGPSAVIPALLMSSLPPYPFFFYGFPPEKEGQRLKLFEELKTLPYTLCFYLSPHKGARHVADIISVLGDRRAALVREISKIYQEAFRASLSEIKQRIEDGVKGELVLVISGQPPEPPEDIEREWRSLIEELVKNGETGRDIIERVTKEYGVPRNLIKEAIITAKEL